MLGIGDRAGADHVDRRDPVVAGRPRHDVGVPIRPHDRPVLLRVVVRDQGRCRVGQSAIRRPLDPVARDRPPAIVGRRVPGEIDPRVARGHGHQPRRPGRNRRSHGRAVVHRHAQARPEREVLRVVADRVLDHPGRVVAPVRVGVGHRHRLARADDGGAARERERRVRAAHGDGADREPRPVRGRNREPRRRRQVRRRRVERLVERDRERRARRRNARRLRHRPADVDGGIRDVRHRAGAIGIERRDPVVVRLPVPEPLVVVGRRRRAGVVLQHLPVAVAVAAAVIRRPLDLVAPDRRRALIGGLHPGEADRGADRRRPEPGRGPRPRHRRGGVGDVGDRTEAGCAGGIPRRDPVVVPRPPAATGVAVGDIRAAVVLQLLPVSVAVAVAVIRRPLDPVARDRPPAGVARRPPREADPRVAAGLGHEPRRPRRSRRLHVRAVGHRQPRERRRVVAVVVLDRGGIVAGARIGVADRDRLPPLDRRDAARQGQGQRHVGAAHGDAADPDARPVRGRHREARRRRQARRDRVERLVEHDRERRAARRNARRDRQRHHDVVGGRVRGLRARAGALAVDRRDPVVARRLRVELHRVGMAPVRAAGVLDQRLPRRVAVFRPLDPVARDQRLALVRGLLPGEVDPGAAHRRGRQPRRRVCQARLDGAPHRIGRVAGADRVGRRDPVVPGDVGVLVAGCLGLDDVLVGRLLVVGGQLPPDAGVDVRRPLDEVAGNRTAAVVRRRTPGQHDPVFAGLGREVLRLARGGPGLDRVVRDREFLEARRVVAVAVLDDARGVVAVGEVAVGDRHRLAVPDGGREAAQHDLLERAPDDHAPGRDRRHAGHRHREPVRRGRVRRIPVERLVEDDRDPGARSRHRRRDRLRPRDVAGGGAIDVRGRARAVVVDRRDPVVARGLGGEAGVAVGGHDLAVLHLGVVRLQPDPRRVAVRRPVDLVAGDGRLPDLRRLHSRRGRSAWSRRPAWRRSFGAVAASPVGAPGTRVVVMALAPTDASPVPIALIAYTR